LQKRALKRSSTLDVGLADPLESEEAADCVAEEDASNEVEVDAPLYS
jgi:hypothetical protein